MYSPVKTRLVDVPKPAACVHGQEEEVFRKASEFVLLHAPQGGNLEDEADTYFISAVVGVISTN